MEKKAETRLIARLVELITDDRKLFAHLWPITLGEPIEPLGTIYDYGDQELAERVCGLLFADRPGAVRLEDVSESPQKLRRKAEAIDAAAVLDLRPGGWGDVREGVLVAHPNRIIRCPRCKDAVCANEAAFYRHYREAECWRNEEAA